MKTLLKKKSPPARVTIFLMYIFVSIPILYLSSCQGKGSGQSLKLQDTAKKQPSITASIPVTCKYNLYIENSGSIDGYVSNSSKFTGSIYNMLADLLTNKISAGISLNLVSNLVCPYKTNASAPDIQNFIYNLKAIRKQNPGNCDVQSSNIPQVINNVISYSPGDVNILVTDCILSLNGQSIDYLEQEKITTKIAMAQALGKHELSTIILKMNSEYTGNYYEEGSGGHGVAVEDINRPYYILIFGSQDKLAYLVNSLPFNKYNGFENSYAIFPPANNAAPSGKILLSETVGSFNITDIATGLSINSAKASKEGRFQFAVAANLSFSKLTGDALIDKSNYQLPANYSIVSVNKIVDSNDETLMGYTHTFTLATTSLQNEQDVTIRCKPPKVPSWVAATSTKNDTNPTGVKQQTQTFGLEYVVNGLYDAYSNYYKDKSNEFTLTVKISDADKVTGSHGSTGIIVISIVIIIIIAIIIKARNN